MRGVATYFAWALAACSLFVGAPKAAARPCFFAQMPNVIAGPEADTPGDTCTTCHSDYGGSARNAFGDAFEAALDCNSARYGIACSPDMGPNNWCPTDDGSGYYHPNNTWAGTSEMHYLDSDNDGYRNALELMAGSPGGGGSLTRHPGYSSSVPCDTCVANAVCSADNCNIWWTYGYSSKTNCLNNQPSTWTCSCGTGYTGNGFVSCSNYNACTGAAQSACQQGIGTNSCNDSAPPSTSYTCSCESPAYTGSGTTSCTDFNVCTNQTPCDNNGDDGASCTDAVAPAKGNTCGCTPFVYTAVTLSAANNTQTCQNYDACTILGNPCNDGADPSGTCTDVPPGPSDTGKGNTCSCNYPTFTQSSPDANGVRGCVAYQACTALGNPCNNDGDGAGACVERDPPLFGNNCTCSTGYSESNPDTDGVRRCLDTNGCLGNPCNTNGDSLATCQDVAAGSGGGNTCGCSAGYQLSIVGNTQTCVNINECASQPCRAEGDTSGTCAENLPGQGYACTSCGAGYATTGGTSPVCRDINACTPSAQAACATTQAGNTCNDQSAPSLGYGCTCGNAAYVLSDSGQSCENRDECLNNPCDDGGNSSAICNDNAAPATGYTCTCGAGYVSNGTTCVDLNECTANPSRCGLGACQNIAGGGGYTCNCNTGYQIDPATVPYSTVCVQENECTNGTNDCSTFATCTDTPGSWTCACLPGYRDNNPANPGHNCVEINECAEGTHLCAPGGTGGTCNNTPGSYTCTCNAGYLGTGTLACTNINECTNGTHLCAPGGAGGTCTDTPGSYTCDCNAGYSGDGTTACTNINECTNGTHLCAPGGAGGTCADTAGSYSCTCNPGYAGSNTTQCTEIDECANPALNDCDVNAMCLNNAGSFTCACLSGYTGNGVVCDDINECDTANPTHDCSANATCTNQPGDFDCACKSGYLDEDEDNPGRLCSNINECSNGTLNDCDVNAFCTDNNGAYTCQCDVGFDDIGSARDGQCINIDECATNTDQCDAVAVCLDLPGSYICTCPAGYLDLGTGYVGECQEINECLDDALNSCDPNATCTNTAGNYTCACNPGYEDLSSGTPGFVCGNIDECAVDALNNCHADADCTDTPGSYTCACKSGYFGDGVNCSNFNECDLGTDNCSANADCADTPGSFTCTCRTGYSGNGVTCNDDDECADPMLNDCSSNGVCTNTPGSYRCDCQNGYTGDGVTCTDVDECAGMTRVCNQDATCANTVGSFTCTCNPGFTGDGQTCDDINECLGTNMCGAHSNCINDVPGQYRCECWATYTGNGVSCFDLNECGAEPNPCTGGRECKNLVAAGPSDAGYECNCPAGQTAADASSACAVVCGDGVLDPSEGCEGEVQGCENCKVVPNWVCRFDSDLGVSDCSDKCSDGFVNPGEECDDGDQNSNTLPDACRIDCKLAHCGDGVVDPGGDEECDDGAGNSAHVADACRLDCTLSRCGDGARDSNEECDDGDEESGDGCSETCQVEDDSVCQYRDAGPDECMVDRQDAGVSLDGGLSDAGIDAGGNGDDVDFDGSIPPYAPDAKSTSVAGCSVPGAERSARASLALWSLLGLAIVLARRRKAR